MRRRSTHSILLVTLTVAIASCGYGDNQAYVGDDDEVDAQVAPDAAFEPLPDAATPPEQCTSNHDEDGDGAIDCDDADCVAAPACGPEMACMDGVDNDLDGASDCADPDCAIAVICHPEGLCGDATDNDLDGDVDCADHDCVAACLTHCPADQLALAVPAGGLPLPVGDSPVTVDFAISAPGVITGAALYLDATHTYDADLDLTLRSPAGATLDLSSDNGSSGDNYLQTYFADTGATAITDGSPPFTGTFRPEQPLRLLDGTASDGVWQFDATDDSALDTGMVQAVELLLCVCDGVAGCELGLACHDQLDNDGDALVDCADSDCAAEPRCIPEPVCDDQLDDDLDGQIDCLDLDCDGVAGCEHGDELTCDDQLDNDGDGAADCADSDCAATAYCLAEDACGDGSDDDEDGAIDCLDPGCDGLDGCEFGVERSCRDGVDNDGDGEVDCGDADCDASFDCAIDECPAGTSKHFYTATDLPIGLFDYQTVTSIIAVSTRGLVAAVAARVDLTHSYDGDLDLVLGTPGGRRELSTNNGSSGDDYVDTRFTDSAAAVIGSTGADTAPFTGAYRPEQALSTLAGVPLDGDWSLAVSDEFAGGTGSLTRFEVLVCACEATSGDCEFGPGACRNDLDDDGDGLIDCAEPSCADDVGCLPETACDDGLDDDVDGLIDCADADCDGVGACTFGAEAACDDGLDNDGDGTTDCFDGDCATVEVCLVEADCDNGSDDDGDGLIDCADPQCAADPWCVPEASCSNGEDDDDDGVVDCAEHGCDGVDGCTFGLELACGDGLDNDGDAAVDCADADCADEMICAIDVCPIGTSKRLYVSTEVPAAIPDPGTVTSTITVASAGLVSAVATRLDIDHTWDSDLDLFLDAPGGSRELSSDNGGSGDDYAGTVLVDAAAAVIGTSGSNSAPFTGRYRPEQPLAALIGTPLAGAWTLRATDDGGGASGSVVGYQLLVCACDADGGACEFGPLACHNGVDDDSDGLVDCEESTCSGDALCVAEEPETSCSDGVDDDGDGATDCLEPACDGSDGCEFGAEQSCDDAVDNDGDALIDCADADCDDDLICAIDACPIGSSKQLFVSTEVPAAIPDPGTVTSTITVAGAGLVTAVATRLDIDHTYTGDLDLFLDAPGGSRELSSDNGGSGDDYAGTVLADAAAAVIGSTGHDSAPFSGRYRPEQPLAALAGTPLAGAWTLRATDDGGGASGSVVGYQLLVCACDAGGGACEFGPLACRNGIDDDSDGLVDCEETTCTGDATCIAATPEASCSDGVDDDGDGAADCLEPACDGSDGCEFGDEQSCNDAVDNDGDGLLDGADPTCGWVVTALPGCAAGQLFGYVGAGLPQSIDVTDTVDLTSDVAVTRAGTVGTMALRFSATHSYAGDLSLSLISPAGTTLDVTSGNGGGGDDYTGTVLVDAAAAVIGSTDNNAAPFSGSYRPEQPLSTLAGESITGTWRARLLDGSNGDGGSWTEYALGVCLAP